MDHEQLSMIGYILKHELKSQFRNGRVKILLSLIVFIWILVLSIGYIDYMDAKKQYEDSVAEVRRNWENQPEKDPHDAAHDGTYVIKPHYPLTILDKGILPFSGQVIHLRAHQRQLSTFKESKDRSGLFRFGEMTISFTLIYLFPLLIIFLGYNAITSEREHQTIRLLAAQGVSFHHLCIGKWLAVFVQILLALAPLIIGALFFGFDLVDGAVTSIEWISLFVMYILYFLTFLSIVILVSITSKSSGSSLMFLLSIWIFMTLIVPKVSTNVSSMLYPFPKLQTFTERITEDKAKGLDGHNFWNEAAKEFQQNVLNQYNVSSIEDLPVVYSGLLLAEGEKYESEIYTKHFNLLQHQYNKQRNIYRGLGFLSPMLPTRFSSMSFTRADYGFLWHFGAQAELYRLKLNTALNMDIAHHAKDVEYYMANDSLWSSMPTFVYAWQPSQEILQNHIPEFLILIVWAFGSFVLMVRFSRSIRII